MVRLKLVLMVNGSQIYKTGAAYRVKARSPSVERLTLGTNRIVQIVQMSKEYKLAAVFKDNIFKVG